MSLIRKHGAVLQAWACLDLVLHGSRVLQWNRISFFTVVLTCFISFYRTCAKALIVSLHVFKSFSDMRYGANAGAARYRFRRCESSKTPFAIANLQCSVSAGHLN